jgi:maleate isomerase
MPDALGYRKKFGVLIPSTNTSVQPEFDEMRPRGVTNHISRIVIPDDPCESDADFSRVMDLIAGAQMAAVDAVMTCRPDHMVLGISSETFWNGLDASRRMREEIASRSGLAVSMASEACVKALQLYKAKRIAILTPYWPIGDQRVRTFFSEAGFDIKRMKGLCCRSPMLIAHVQPDELRRATLELDGDDIDAIVQCGTNLAFARQAAGLEQELKKPVIAVNTAIYWHALRACGVEDRSEGWGSLLAIS